VQLAKQNRFTWQGVTNDGPLNGNRMGSASRWLCALLFFTLAAGVTYILLDENTLSLVVSGQLMNQTTHVQTLLRTYANFTFTNATTSKLQGQQDLNTSASAEDPIAIPLDLEAQLLPPTGQVVNTTLGDFPPDPDVVTYSGEGLLVMPRDPDPKSQYMKDLAFYYGNGTAFVHDEVSSNYSLCPVTSQIKINLQDWTVTTYGPDGTVKDRGGDDLFIYYEDPGIGGFACIARSTDHGNGTYSLEFKNSPYFDPNSTMAEKGRLTVWLEYTCDVGKIMRPFKDSWATNGATLTKWTAEGVPRPPITVFVPPNADKAINLGLYRVVMGAGDSVMQHFVSPRFNRFYFVNLAFDRNLADALLSRSVYRQCRLSRGRLGDYYRANFSSVALVVGFAAWELQKPFGNNPFLPGQPYADQDLFPEHIEALTQYINTMRATFPGLKVFWKTGQYPHLHIAARDRGNDWYKIDRLAYMSPYRTYYLYEMQKARMRELDVPILDVMEASYLMPDHNRAFADTLHYDIPTNGMLVSWFYPNGFNESAVL
jgi:hypothetical protein